MTSISVVHNVTWKKTDWARLGKLGDYVYFPGYPANEQELIQRIGNADIVIGADVPFSEYVLSSAPSLKMISLWSTGYDNVDLSAARKRGVIISNVPGYSAYSVAEHTWAMVLALAKKLSETDAYVRSGKFDWSAIWGFELFGKTIGILGVGAIGTHSAQIARGFGCQVIAFTKHPDPDRATKLHIQFVSLDELLTLSDVILLHLPLTAETHNIINTAAFEKMLKQPILVNTSRGNLIEMSALIQALKDGKISGLGLDVMWQEPPNWDDAQMRKFLSLKRVILSPHNASHTAESYQRLTSICIDNIEAYLRGEFINKL